MKPTAAHQTEKIVYKRDCFINVYTFKIGGKLNLIPYEAHHVPTYHAWLQDPHIQEMTATEPVDLQTEYDYQQELMHSTDRII